MNGESSFAWIPTEKHFLFLLIPSIFLDFQSLHCCGSGYTFKSCHYRVFLGDEVTVSVLLVSSLDQHLQEKLFHETP